MNTNKLLQAISLFTLLTSLFLTPSFAVDKYWQAADGDWLNVTNWSPNDIPTSSDRVYLNTGTARLSGTSNSATGLVGNDVGSQGNIIVFSSGFWNNPGNLLIGNLGSGYLNITDSGSVNNYTGFIAYGTNSQGNVNISSSGFWNNTGTLFVGYYGSGSLSITDSGSVKNSGGAIGYYAGSQGSVSSQAQASGITVTFSVLAPTATAISASTIAARLPAPAAS